MKKIIFLLFLTTHLAFAQVKPIKFGLHLKINLLDFPEDKRPILTKLSNELLKVINNHINAIAKNKCIDYRGIDAKATDMDYIIQFHKGTAKMYDNQILGDYDNVPMAKLIHIDNFKADTLSSPSNVMLLTAPKSKESDFQLLESDFPAIVEIALMNVDIFFMGSFPPCERILDYKLQKRHRREVVIVGYPTITKDKDNSKYLQIVDKLFNNFFIDTQITDEKNKNVTDYFIFYPYNKDTKDIKSDITIQLHLMQDKTGNYELKGELKGENLNLRYPGGEEMKTSIKFDKKRLDSGDYTELIYKLGEFANEIHVCNVFL